MTNPRASGHLPLKTPMTSKWKTQAPNSDLLERQTRALEESLNKLKIAMNPDKSKPATESSTSIWNKGKSGPITQYANYVLRDDGSRRLFDTKQPKVRILGDEPAVPVLRPSLVANLYNVKPNSNTHQKIAKCGQFGADVVFNELRQVKNIEDNLMNSLYESTRNDEVDNDDHTVYSDDEISDNNSARYGGGALLEGTYNEKNSAASFQQALLQWRNTNTTTSNSNNKKPSRKTQIKSKTLKKNVHAYAVTVDSTQTPNENQQPMVSTIEFHTTKLTYAEKLLLKKYRRTTKNEEFFVQRPSSKLSKNDSARFAILEDESENTIENDLHVPVIKNNKPTEKDLNVSQSQLNVKNNYFGLTNPNNKIKELYNDIKVPDQNEFSTSNDSVQPLKKNKDNAKLVDHDHDEMLTQRTSRPTSRAKLSSRPNSAVKKMPSRPSSALFQHPLPSMLSINPSEDLLEITSHSSNNSKDIPSRPSSAALKKPTKIDYKIQSIWNRNWKPENSLSDGVDLFSVKPDEISMMQFDLALKDLLDETKIEATEVLSNRPSSSVSDLNRPLNFHSSSKDSNYVTQSFQLNPQTPITETEKTIDDATKSARNSARSTDSKKYQIDFTQTKSSPIHTVSRNKDERQSDITHAIPTILDHKTDNRSSSQFEAASRPHSGRSIGSTKAFDHSRPASSSSELSGFSKLLSSLPMKDDGGSETPKASIENQNTISPRSTPTPRNFPFDFNITKTHHASPRSRNSKTPTITREDSEDNGFFTDLPRQNIVKEVKLTPEKSSTSNENSSVLPSTEWKQTLTNRSGNNNTEYVIPNLLLKKSTDYTQPKTTPRLSQTKRSITLDETNKKTTTIDDYTFSRPTSSLSSASLPVSIISSKPELITKPSIEANPHRRAVVHRTVTNPTTNDNHTTVTTTAKKFRIDFNQQNSKEILSVPSSNSKKISTTNANTHIPQSVNPQMVVEGKKVSSSSEKPVLSARISNIDGGDFVSSSTNSLNANKLKSSITSSTRSIKHSGSDSVRDSNANVNEQQLKRLHPIVNGSVSSTLTSITRDENNIRDSVAIRDSLLVLDKDNAAAAKNSISDSNFVTTSQSLRPRKLEFTLGDGARWKESSIDSSSTHQKTSINQKVNSSSNDLTRPLSRQLSRCNTPSSKTNAKLAEQYVQYEDDGRSSRLCQDVEDEQCFNQLREELCSQLGSVSPGWDASLSEHVLKNLRTIVFSEKDLQDNLEMLEAKLRETESVQRSETNEDDFMSYEEIRNL
ncbi:unnamed protein product [Didymodactylos carnosus]|uniref:Uncharacterized protein n=1 Tax=Didymodactylos carnosus TaxID=1234261 RepID=A0A813T4M7_9BILA|nr:unnamed protein product [Didymodactylos carnosus]CAF3589981.1 unnamed protein product [Didymodactylos carnosus]